MELNYIAVDLETTGLSPHKDRIIEIGAAKVLNGEIVDTFSTLVNPEIELSIRITELTGITDDMLVGKPLIKDVIHKFIEFAEELPLLGHNILFDYSFLKTQAAKENLNFERKGIDTLYISRALHEDFESRALGFMCEQYGIVQENSHRAYDDAISAMKLYKCLACKEAATLSMLAAKPLYYQVKKIEPITLKQKNYLLNLLKYHKIENVQSLDSLTKSEASRLIDRIILNHGRKQD